MWRMLLNAILRSMTSDCVALGSPWEKIFSTVENGFVVFAVVCSSACLRRNLLIENVHVNFNHVELYFTRVNYKFSQHRDFKAFSVVTIPAKFVISSCDDDFLYVVEKLLNVRVLITIYQFFFNIFEKIIDNLFQFF